MLEKLLNKIIEGKMFLNNELLDIDEDYVLDLRDKPEFEKEWLRIFEKFKNIELTETEILLINKIREQSFLAVYNITGSDELAGYISDDFEIICKGIISKFNDSWLNSFMFSYANYKFPYGELENTNLQIEDIIKKLVN